MFLWACAGVPLGIYNIVKDFNIALRIQPQILTFLSLITLGQCLYYEQVTTVTAWSDSIEVFISEMYCRPRASCDNYGGNWNIGCFWPTGLRSRKYTDFQVPERKGIEWPMTLTAVIAACLLSAGVLRHYWDIYMYRTVRGISFTFVAIDAAGDLFSLVSLGFLPDSTCKITC